MNGSVKNVKDCLSKLEASLKCSICLDTFTDPVKTKCGHNFCSTCIKTAMNGKGSVSCPLCKAVITKRNHTKTVHLEKVILAVHSIHNALEADFAGMLTQKHNTISQSKTRRKSAKNVQSLHPKAIFPQKDSDAHHNSTPDMLDVVDDLFVEENEIKNESHKKMNHQQVKTLNSTPDIVLKSPGADSTCAENNKAMNNNDPFLFPDSQKEKPKTSGKKMNKKVVVKKCGKKKSNVLVKSTTKKAISKSVKLNKEKQKIEPISPQDKQIVESIISAEHHQLIIEGTRVRKKVSMSTKKKTKEGARMKVAKTKCAEQESEEMDSPKNVEELSSPPNNNQENKIDKSTKSFHVHWKNSSSLQSIIPDNLTEETPACDSNSESNKPLENITSPLNNDLNCKSSKRSNELKNNLPINESKKLLKMINQNDSDNKKDSMSCVDTSPAIDKYIADHPRLSKYLVYSSESSSSLEQNYQEPKNVVSQTSQIGFEDKVKSWLENVEPGLNTNEINSIDVTMDLESKLDKDLEDHTSVSQTSQISRPKKIIKRPVPKKRKTDKEPKMLKQNIFNVKGISQGVSPFSSPASTSGQNENIRKDGGLEKFATPRDEDQTDKDDVEAIGQPETVTEVGHTNNVGSKSAKIKDAKSLTTENLLESGPKLDKKDDSRPVQNKEIDCGLNKITYTPVLSTQPSENTSIQVSQIVTTTTGIVHQQNIPSPNLHSPKKFQVDANIHGAIRLDNMPIICVAETEENTQESVAYYVESPPEGSQPSEREDSVLPVKEKSSYKESCNFDKPTVELGLFDFSEPTPASQSTTTENKVLFNQLNDSSEKLLETSRTSDHLMTNSKVEVESQYIDVEMLEVQNNVVIGNQHDHCTEEDVETPPISHRCKGLTSPSTSTDVKNESSGTSDQLEISTKAPVQHKNFAPKNRGDVIQNSVEEEEDFKGEESNRRGGLRRRKTPRVQLRARNSKMKKKNGRKSPADKNSVAKNDLETVESVSPKKLFKDDESDAETSKEVKNIGDLDTNEDRKPKSCTSTKSPTPRASKSSGEDIDMVCTSNGWGGSKLKIRIFQSEEEEEKKKSLPHKKIKKNGNTGLQPLASDEFLNCGASGMIQEYIKNRENLLSQSGICKEKRTITARKTINNSISAQKLAIQRENHLKELLASTEFDPNFDIDPFPSSWPTTSTSKFNFDSLLPSCGLLSEVKVVLNKLDDETVLKYTTPREKVADEKEIFKTIPGDDELPSSPLLFQTPNSPEENLTKNVDCENRNDCRNSFENGDLDLMSYLKGMEELIDQMENLSEKFKKFNKVEKVNEIICRLKSTVKDSVLEHFVDEKQAGKPPENSMDVEKGEDSDVNAMQIDEEEDSPFDREDIITISSSLPQNKDCHMRPKKHQRKSSQFPNSDVSMKILKENQNIEPQIQSPNPLKRTRDSACSGDENEQKKLDGTSAQQIKRLRKQSIESHDSQTTFHTPQSMIQNSKSLLDSHVANQPNFTQNLSPIKVEQVPKERKEEEDQPIVIQDSPTSPPPETYSDEDFASTEEDILKVVPETEAAESEKVELPRSSSVNNSEVVPASFTQVSAKSTTNRNNEVDDLLRRISEFTCEMSESSNHDIAREASKSEIKPVDSQQTMKSQQNTTSSLNNSINHPKTSPAQKLPSSDNAATPKNISNKFASSSTKTKSPISIPNYKETPLVSQPQKSGHLQSVSTDIRSPKKQAINDESQSQIENVKPRERNSQKSEGMQSTNNKKYQKENIVVKTSRDLDKREHRTSLSTTMSDKSSQQSSSQSKSNLDNSPRRGDRRCLAVMGSGLQGKALDIVRLFTKKFKGNYYNTFETGKVTHLIVKTNHLKCSRTLKYLQALSSKIWILDIHWAVDSLKQRKLLPREAYEVVGEIDHSIMNGPKTCRLSPKSSKILTDFHIHCFPPFSAFSTRDIEELCQLSGAQVVKSPVLMNNIHSDNKVLIFDIDAYDASIPNYAEIAQQCGATAASYNWLCECIATNSILPLSDFPVEEFDSEFSE